MLKAYVCAQLYVRFLQTDLSQMSAGVLVRSYFTTLALYSLNYYFCLHLFDFFAFLSEYCTISMLGKFQRTQVAWLPGDGKVHSIWPVTFSVQLMSISCEAIILLPVVEVSADSEIARIELNTGLNFFWRTMHLLTWVKINNSLVVIYLLTDLKCRTEVLATLEICNCPPPKAGWLMSVERCWTRRWSARLCPSLQSSISSKLFRRSRVQYRALQVKGSWNWVHYDPTTSLIVFFCHL